MAQLSTFTVADGTLSIIEKELWPIIKDKLRPVVWAWYDANKDHKITKILGVYTVTYGSFGIAAAVITVLIGPRPVSV